MIEFDSQTAASYSQNWVLLPDFWLSTKPRFSGVSFCCSILACPGCPASRIRSRR